MQIINIINLLVSPEGIYGAIVGVIILSLIIYRLAIVLSSFLSSSSFLSLQVRPFLLNHIAYARSFGCIPGLRSTSRLHLILISFYLMGTGACNVIKVYSIADAGNRAAKLCLLNLVPMFLGGGYEFGARILGISLRTYGFVHRSFAIVAFVEALVHIIIEARIKIMSWSNQLQLYGLLAAGALLALVVLPLVKKRVYEAFLVTHLGCAMVMVYGIWQHTRSVYGGLWVFPVAYIGTFVITGALQLLRVIYRNMVMGRNPIRLILHPHDGNVARLTLSLPRPWAVRAGERINLGVPHVGIFYLFQAHPFVISWWEVDCRGRAISISILFRPRSGFTKKLLGRVEPNRECGAWIDGPFGPSRVNWRLTGAIGDYGHIFMVATGIGIAAQLPYIKEVLDGHDKAQARTQRISLVWQLDRTGDWESARDWLQSLVRQDNGYMLHVAVYDQLRAESGNEIQRIGENGLIEVHSGRLKWEEKLDSEIKNQVGKLLVTVSARAQVRHDIRDLVRARVDKGIELFEQEFQPWGQTGSLRTYLKP